MGEFDFKAFYAIYKEALIEDNQTEAVASLFKPILSLRFFPNNIKDKNDTVRLEIDAKKASEWAIDPKRTVRRDVAKAAQSADAADKIIDHFENVIIPYELSDYALDEMVERMLQYAFNSFLQQEKKTLLKDLVDEQETGEFLARAFIFSLEPSKRQKVNTTEKSGKSVEEFNKVVLNKASKPKTVVPVDIDKDELEYVNALLAAYEEATGDEYSIPEDVIDTEYEGHFMQQRKNYYQAETIHRAIRDSVSQEDEDFDVLKEEVEDGLYTVSHRKYSRGIDKADTVLDAAGNLPISPNSDNAMMGWVGPGEKRGVCHMLVNDHKLTWVEDNENDK